MNLFFRLLQLSWRNVCRNKRRSVLSLLILILGSTGLILVGGFFDNLTDQLRETYIHSISGHLQVNQAGFYEKGARAPFEYLMQDFQATRRLIEKQPHVAYTVPRLYFGGMLSSDRNSVSVTALGVDAALERRMVNYQYAGLEQKAASVVIGQDLDPKDPYGILVGEGLMKALGLKIGDTVSFITARDTGAIDGASFQVRGAFRAALKEIGDRVIKVNLDTAQGMLDFPDRIHSLLVVLDETAQTEPVGKKLQTLFEAREAPLEIISWSEQGELYRQSKRFLDQIFHVVLLILSIVIFLSIANTINMSLFERMREYGTMMALGNGRSVVFSQILIEAILIALLGSVLGSLFGSGIAQLVSMAGFQMPPPPVSSSSIGSLNIMILLSPHLLGSAFCVSFFATTLSSLVPGYRASHFPIVQALGYV